MNGDWNSEGQGARRVESHMNHMKQSGVVCVWYWSGMCVVLEWYVCGMWYWSGMCVVLEWDVCGIGVGCVWYCGICVVLWYIMRAVVEWDSLLTTF
jgi:hypothetical protein